MITAPLNDTECLELVHAKARGFAANAVLVDFAHAFDSPEEIAAFLRTRPLELDVGDPLDGPRIACVPSQRLRLLPDGVNCMESSFHYLGLADIIDPSTPRTSCTIRVGDVYHTFPVERGQPVILDPEAPPRNAFEAGVYTCERRNGLRPAIVQLGEARTWLVRVAANAARTPSERAAIQAALRALNRSLYRGERLTDLHAIATMIALAETEAPLWGDEGREALTQATQSVRNLLQRTELGSYVGLARRIGERALKGYIIAQTGPLGPVLLDELKGREPRRPTEALAELAKPEQSASL